MFKLNRQLKEKFRKIRVVTIEQLAILVAEAVHFIFLPEELAKIEEYKEVTSKMSFMPNGLCCLDGIYYTNDAIDFLNLAMDYAIARKKKVIGIRELEEVVMTNNNPVWKYMDTPFEKLELPAIHESSHCIVNQYLRGRKMLFITILPSTTTRGINAFQRMSEYKDGEDIFNEIAMLVAGGVGLEVCNDDYSQEGCESDFNKAVEMANYFIDNCEYEFEDYESVLSEILNNARELAREILVEHFDQLVDLVELLLIKKAICGDDLEKFFAKKS